MPAAYFYPNVMQWTPPPGGFYDINSFLQFNGLSPQGTFTPHNPGPTLRYPPNRRNTKHRDNNRYEKENRHTTTTTTTPNPTHYPRQQQQQQHHHHHRPHPTPSPSQPHPRPPSRAPPSAAPTPPPPPPLESFAQNDISLATQSGLYTSFSPPASVEKEVVTVSTTPLAAVKPPSTPSSPAHSPPPTTEATEGPQTTTTAPPPPPQPPLPHLHQPPHMHPRHHHHHHHHHHQFPPPHHLAQGLSGPPPPPPPHRHGNYPPDHFHPHHHHPPHLHQQGPRSVFDDRHPYYHRPRNTRRRPRGREEEMLGGPGRGGPPQRTNGTPHQPPGGEAKQGTPTPQEGTPAPPPPPPQFDLEAASFPPLPSSDEPAVAVVVERRSAEPLTSAWGDTQRFSDVTKGKPRPPSIGDTPTDTPPTPTSATATQTPPTTTVTPTTPTPAPQTLPATTTTTTTAPAATTTASQPPTTTTTTTTPPPTTTDDHNHHQIAPAAPNPAPTPPAPAPTPPTPKPEARLAPRDQRVERRPVGGGNGPRERREFPREYPQRSQTGGREYRGSRDPTLRAGKENRPLRPREDADGWITKGSRESRAQRESREQWERGDAAAAAPSSSSSSSSSRHHYNNNNNSHHLHHHNHHLVNGDSASPPSSPKPQKGEGKMADECTDTAKGVPARPLNNNEGEHKTTWAKMALASKDQMERLATELKEKEEQEKIMKQRLATRPQPRPQEKVVTPRERDGKMVRRDAVARDPRGLPGERGGPIPFRPRDAATPKSPK